MISRRTWNNLLAEYRQASSHVSEASLALEAAAMSITGAGEGFTRESARLLDQVNALYVAINRFRSRLREVRCDD